MNFECAQYSSLLKAKTAKKVFFFSQQHNLVHSKHIKLNIQKFAETAFQRNSDFKISGLAISDAKTLKPIIYRWVYQWILEEQPLIEFDPWSSMKYLGV